jgi:hypothetical protein
MSKQRKRKPRRDAVWLAKQMEAVATMMWTVAESMEYAAGFDQRLKNQAIRLAAHSEMLDRAASQVREKANLKGSEGKQ